MYIWATMNSADQGVFPLDTAFRRRWEQRYFPLYGDMVKYPRGSILISAEDGDFSIDWKDFVKAINYKLADLGTPEDRLMGIWFARESELNGAIPMKVLLYLWDDVLRHQHRKEIFSDKLRTFGDINDALQLNQPVLASELLSMLKASAEQSRQNMVALQGGQADPMDDGLTDDGGAGAVEEALIDNAQ